MKSIGKARQALLYAGPFPALAFFKIWAASGPSSGSLAIVALLMLAFCAIIIAFALKWDKPTYFDWTVAFYFGLISLSLTAWPDAAGRLLSEYAVTGIYLSLFAASFFPPLLGMAPFTFHYAKKSTPRVFWDNPIFISINRTMTYVWAGIFAVSAALSLYPSVITRAVIPLAVILGLGLPFNLRFPDFHLRRLGLPTLREQRRMALGQSRVMNVEPIRAKLPESAWEAISRMPAVFNGDAAGNLSGVIGFAVSGAENFKAYLVIRNGACVLEKEADGKVDLTIRTPADVWLSISRGELSGQEAFMRQAYKAEGDLGMLMRMKDLFAGSSSSPGVKDSVQKEEKSFAAPAVKGAEAAPREPVYRKKEGAMKILAVNSSPRSGGESKTELMMNHLVLGMREAGADVEVVDLRKKKINPCAGCFTCWTKTPGICIHKDDMTNELFPKFLQSDLVVYGSPLYYFTVNATMKTFIERTLPILQPFLNDAGGKTEHPLRHPLPKAVFLSVAGFPEMSVFDQLSAWARFVYGRNGNLVAEIYRPAAESLVLPFFREKSEDVLAAVREAGKEIVQDMKVSQETMARITQDIAGGKDVIRKMANLMWKSCIAEGLTPKEFVERGVPPRPDSIESFMMLFQFGFKPDAAGDTRAVIQFDFSGETKGACHFRIEKRRIEAIQGSAQSPDLTIESPFEVWMDIMAGKADGQQMFMAQKYRATGDLSLLIRMGQLFGK